MISQSLHDSLMDRSKRTNYNWYHCYLHVPKVFLLFVKIQAFVCFFVFFSFYSDGRQNPLDEKFFSGCFFNIMSGLLAGIELSVYISKINRILCVSFSWTGAGFWLYYFSGWSNFSLLHNSPRINFQQVFFLCKLAAFVFIWLADKSLPPHNQHFSKYLIFDIIGSYDIISSRY